MNAKDLELLGLLRQLNVNIPGFVLRLTDDMPNGTLPADLLRELGAILHGVGDQFLARAEEIDPAPNHPVVIDGGSG